MEPPARYPHEPERHAAAPPLEYLTTARPGVELLLIEPGGKRYRAVVEDAQQFAVVVTCRTEPAPPKPRAFALNGLELGAYPAAELREMPADLADRLRRRELFLTLTELIAEHGEDVLPVAALAAAVYAARRFARERAEARTRFFRLLERSIRSLTNA